MANWKTKAVGGIGALVLTLAPGYAKNSNQDYVDLKPDNEQVMVDDTNYASSALEDITNVLNNVGAKSANAGGLDYQSMAKEMEELNENDKHQAVIDDYKMFANDDGNNSALFFNELGTALSEAGNLDQEIAAYEKSVHLGGVESAYFNLGISYIEKAKHSDSKERKIYLSKAIEPWEHYKKIGNNDDRVRYVEQKLDVIKNYLNK